MDPGDPGRVADTFSLWLFKPDQMGPVTVSQHPQYRHEESFGDLDMAASSILDLLNESQLSFDLFALGIPSHFNAVIPSSLSQEDGDSAARADSRVAVVNDSVEFAAENCWPRMQSTVMGSEALLPPHMIHAVQLPVDDQPPSVVSKLLHPPIYPGSWGHLSHPGPSGQKKRPAPEVDDISRSKRPRVASSADTACEAFKYLTLPSEPFVALSLEATPSSASGHTILAPFKPDFADSVATKYANHALWMTLISDYFCGKGAGKAGFAKKTLPKTMAADPKFAQLKKALKGTNFMDALPYHTTYDVYFCVLCGRGFAHGRKGRQNARRHLIDAGCWFDAEKGALRKTPGCTSGGSHGRQISVNLGGLVGALY